MSNKKQTAVEWLLNEISLTTILDKEDVKLFKQAKELEKQQIIDFTNSFINEHTFGDYDGNVQINKTVEDYYNETFKK